MNETTPQQEQPPKNKNTKMLGIIYLLISIIIVGVIAFAVYYNFTKDDDDTTTTNGSDTESVETGNYSYKLYTCPDTYNEDITECFTSVNRVSATGDIHIHGSYAGMVSTDFVSLFIVFKDCPDCDTPQYLDFDTATKSETECQISASVDLNNFGIYNQNIFPSEEPYDSVQLRAKDTVRIPIAKYGSEGVDSFMITPNPAGCDLLIRSFQVF